MYSPSYYGDYYLWMSDDANYEVLFDYHGRPVKVTNVTISMPGFLCIDATTEAEKTICSDKTLANIDYELSEKYALATKYLTGQDYKILRNEQESFIQKRNACTNNLSCVWQAIGLRAEQLDIKIKQELAKKWAQLDHPEYKKMDEVWKSERYFQAASCSSASEDEDNENTDLYITISGLDVSVYRKILNSSKSSAKCKISRVHHSNSRTQIKIYKDNISEISENWGRCGGDIKYIPYAGYYTYMELTAVEAPASLRKKNGVNRT